jgi:hypothetical protein
MLCQVNQVTYSGHWFCHKKNPPFMSLHSVLVTVIWFVYQTLLNTHHDKIRVLGFLGFDAKFLYHHECNSELSLYAPSCIQNNKLHCTLQSMRLLGTIHTQNWLHHYLKVVHKKKTEFVHLHFCIQSGVCFMFLSRIILPPSQRT